MILLADAVSLRKSRIIILIMFRPLELDWRSERRVRWFYRFVSMKVFPGLLHILSICGMLNSDTLQLNFEKQSLSFSATNIKPTFSSMATRIITASQQLCMFDLADSHTRCIFDINMKRIWLDSWKQFSALLLTKQTG